jgi:homoserine O-acetyltransferase
VPATHAVSARPFAWIWGVKYRDFMDAVVPMTSQPAEMSGRNRLAAPFPADANDVLYQWDASRDYNAAPGLERIQATLLAINSADDERIPPETGIMERELKRVKSGRLFLIPGSEDTSGHSTVFFAKFWKQQVQELLQTAPRRSE